MPDVAKWKIECRACGWSWEYEGTPHEDATGKQLAEMPCTALDCPSIPDSPSRARLVAAATRRDEQGRFTEAAAKAQAKLAAITGYAGGAMTQTEMGPAASAPVTPP